MTSGGKMKKAFSYTIRELSVNVTQRRVRSIEHLPRINCSFSIIVLLLAYLCICSFASAATNGKIAFASNRDGNYEIYTMNPDGTALTRVTFDAADNNHPSYSRDGKRIAFTCSGNICAMNADGTNETQI